jgi:signal transduction histidine kinase
VKYIRYLLISLTLLFAMVGLILYFNMFHFACVVSFSLALVAGGFFTVFLVRQHKEALDRQEALRRRLTADMAHELRTPLTCVGSYLEAMHSGMWEATTERLRACHDEIIRLGRLVAELERLAAAESDRSKLEKTRVDLLELVRAVSGNMSAEAAKKMLSLSVGGESAVVFADRERMAQVVTNLLSNAIKYTPEGGHIRAEVTDAAANGVISVRDNGIGISERELPLVFERFYRTDASRSRKTGGAGIGLTIARSITAAHGGAISAESREGEGSCFTVVIPKKRR